MEETIRKMEELVSKYDLQLRNNEKLLNLKDKRINQLEEEKKSLEVSSNIIGFILLILIILNGAQLFMKL
jgi:hypothetical protein